MSATPETDAAQHEGLLRTNPIPMQVVTANFARKLERERDEAQRELEMWKFERDEAMEHAACYRLEANKLIMMGIELREQNAKLRDIAEKAITAVALWAGSRTNSASKLRAELNQLKKGEK